MNSNIFVDRLTSEKMNTYLPQLIRLDGKYSSLSSGMYSREIWNEDNFLMDLEDKWGNSWYILYNNLIAGFAILSRKEQDTMHINRLAVDINLKNHSQLSEILMRTIEGGVQVDRITLIVSTENVKAVHYYRKNGFDIIYGDRLENILEQRKMHVNYIGENYYIDGGKYHDSHYVMERTKYNGKWSQGDTI